MKTLNLAVLKMKKIEHCTYITQRCLNPKWLYKKLSRILFDELIAKLIIG